MDQESIIQFQFPYVFQYKIVVFQKVDSSLELKYFAQGPTRAPFNLCSQLFAIVILPVELVL